MARITNGILNAIFGASAGAGDAVDPSSIFSTGWPDTYEDPTSGLFPEREYFNYLFRALYSIGKDVNTHGILEWSNAVDYTHPAFVVASDGIIYQSIQNSGPSGAGAQDPTTATTYWERIPTYIAPLQVVNSMLASQAVSQAKLKTSTGTVSTTADISQHTLPGGEYGFYPQIRCTENAAYYIAAAYNSSDAWVTHITIDKTDAIQTAYARQRYVTSSGEVYWIFMLKDRSSDKIISMWQAPDHPCFGNGGDPLTMPQPFGDYDSNIHDIIVCNPDISDVLRMREMCKTEGKGNLDILDIVRDYMKISSGKVDWPSAKVTVGLPPDIDYLNPEHFVSGVEVIKKGIPKPDFVSHKKLIFT